MLDLTISIILCSKLGMVSSLGLVVLVVLLAWVVIGTVELGFGLVWLKVA